MIKKTLLSLFAITSLGVNFAWAQDSKIKNDTPSSVEPSRTNESYQDKIIDPANLQVLPDDEEENKQNLNKDGLLRSLTIEFLVGQSKRGNSTFNEYQVELRGHQTTQKWGDFSLDAKATRQDENAHDFFLLKKNKNSFQATLWQRNFFISDYWYMNNGLGILTTPSTSVQRQQQRFFLPSVPFAGVTSETVSTKTGTVIQASTGKIGLLQGGRSTSFDIQSGNVSSLGAEWNVGSWRASTNFLAVDGLVNQNEYNYEFQKGSTHALYAGARREAKKHNTQVNTIFSQNNKGDAWGVWIDDEWRRGRATYSAGLFYLENNLAWGAYPINNNVQGGYYRLNYLYGKLAWSASIDYIDSIDKNGFSGVYSSSSVRYQKTSSLGLGGTVSQRSGSDSAYSAMVYLDKKTKWGQSRIQFQSSSGTSTQENAVTFDQTFKTKEGTRLAASLNLTHGSATTWTSTNSATQDTKTAQLNIYGGVNITNQLSIDGTVGFTHGNGFYESQGFNMNVGANWQISNRLNIQATFYQTQGRHRKMFNVDPLANPNEFVPMPKDQSFAISFRYNLQKGHAMPILGASSRAAVSDIQGEIFFDENKDGLRNASEYGIENVSVTLDGKYTVSTDSQGRFYFNRVAVGDHHISVLEDNIPLPWSLDDSQKSKMFTLHLRNQNPLSLGATKSN